MLNIFQKLSKELFDTRYAVVKKYSGDVYVSKLYVVKTEDDFLLAINSWLGRRILVNKDGSIDKDTRETNLVISWKEIF